MVASAVFLTDVSGKSIISRNYRGDVPLTKAIERFAKYLNNVDDEAKKPVFHVDVNGDVMAAEEVGGTGVGGETYVYVAVRMFSTTGYRKTMPTEPDRTEKRPLHQRPWHDRFRGLFCCFLQSFLPYIPRVSFVVHWAVFYIQRGDPRHGKHTTALANNRVFSFMTLHLCFSLSVCVHLCLSSAVRHNVLSCYRHGPFCYAQHNNLYLCAVTRKNSNVALILTFLDKLISVFKDYFGNLEEESIRDNFVIIYELLDETMDHGLPQSLDSTILRSFITQEGNRMKEDDKSKPPVALTNAVSWRSEGIKHKKNEIFLDVVEKLNLLVAANGTVLHSEINGAVKMKSFLSGMPELKLGLNDKLMFEATGRQNQARVGKAVELEDIKFHQCVRLTRFENDRTISFIPPDGEFDLMTYRLNTHVKPLIWVEAVVEPHKGSRIEYMIKTRSQFKSRSVANNVEIIIPVPPDVDSPSFKSSVGSVTYLPDKDAVVWTIKQFHGGREYLMRAHFGLPSISAADVDSDAKKKGENSWKAPIRVKFEIPYFTVSGIQVRYLKIIERSGYQALPWVRYITANGDYQLRMA